MTYKFTKSSEDALKIASEIAAELGHNYIGTEHILYGLAEEQIGVGVGYSKKESQQDAARMAIKKIRTDRLFKEHIREIKQKRKQPEEEPVVADNPVPVEPPAETAPIVAENETVEVISEVVEETTEIKEEK